MKKFFGMALVVLLLGSSVAGAEQGNGIFADAGASTEKVLESAKDYYEQGRVLLSDQSKRMDAIECFSKAIEIDPDYIPAYKARIELYMMSKKFDLALKDMNTVLEKPLDSKDKANFHYERGLYFEKSGDHSGALKDYDKALEADPKYSYASSAKIRVYKTLERYELALAELDASYEKNSDPERRAIYHHQRATILVRSDKIEGAIVECTKAVENNPAYAHAYELRASLYQKMQNYEFALSDATKAIEEISSPIASPYLLRGAILREMGDIEGAISNYTKAIEINPLSRRNRFDFYSDIGKYDLALADIEIMIKENPSVESNYSVLKGVTLRKSGDLEGAIRVYTQAIEKRENYFYAYDERSKAYEEQGRYDLALADYTTLILKNPKSAACYRGRAEIYYRMGNTNLAAEDFEKALELINKDAKSEYFLGEIYENHFKDKEKALVYYRLALKNASPIVQKGIIQKAEEAIQRLEGK